MNESLRVLVLFASAVLWTAVGVAWVAEAGLFARLRWNWQACPPLRRALAALAVAVAVAYAGTKPEATDGLSTNRHGSEQGVGVSTNRHESTRMGEAGAGEEGVSSKEQVVSAEDSSSVVAVDGTQQDDTNHTCSLLPTPSSLPRDTYSLLPTPCSLSDEDVSRGYRLVSVATNEAHSYEMPPDARLVGTWHLTDAYDAVAKVFLEGTFPLGGQVVTSLWAHVWGKARPQLGNASNELVAVGAPMFARRGVSCLWTASTTNGSVLLTWQNFFFKGVSSKEEGAGGEGVSSKEQVVSADGSSSVVAVGGTEKEGNDHTYSLLLAPSSLSSVSAQLELSRDGSFVAWSNSVARAYRRVNPDDWDGDGIPNDEDDDPRVAADEPRFGPRQSLPQGAHTNNYYWVDLAVRDADALVSFAGDAPSNLPDPSFVARAGETNRVTLLIGKAYAVSCLLPVSVVGKSSDAVEVRQEPDGTLRLRWPVAIGIREGEGAGGEGTRGDGVSSKEEGVSAEGEGVGSKEQGVSAEDSSSVVAAGGTQQDVALHTYSLLLTPYYLKPPAPYSSPQSSSFTMVLTPPWLVGAFAWTNGCCRVSGDGPVFSLSCGGGCACGGCAAAGFFAYEGYRLPARGGSCPCNGSGAIVPGEIGGEEPGPLPGASARFSRRVILFEDEYEDAPGVSVPWRSTETELDCSASGGPNGGRVRIKARGADGLVPYGGRPLPFERELGPFESVAFRNAYRAVRPSGGEGDIVVTATFEENGTGAAWTSEDRATAVRVTICPKLDAPENPSRQRHKFGVGEAVDCSLTPTTDRLSWRCTAGGSVTDAKGNVVYTAPLHATSNDLRVSDGDAEYVPETLVVEPSGISARDVGYRMLNVPPGQAGGILLTATLHVQPLDVSFLWVKVEEVPDAGGSHDGYFADPYFMSEWLHGKRQGAGVWRIPTGDNQFLADEAGIMCALPQLGADGHVSKSGICGWKAGTLVWEVPCGWASPKAEEDDSPVGVFARDAKQVMTIDADGGCEVRKQSNWVRRTVGDAVYLNGVKVK